MLAPNDEKLLQRAITRGQCVLFLGAGFSEGATNQSGTALPVSRILAERMWAWLGYSDQFGDYDHSPLDRMFDVARKERGDKKLLAFLEEQLLVKTYPKWYQQIAYPYWYRVYTTNVDDLVEHAFADARSAKLDVLNANTARYKERDPYFERLQYVKLNGSIARGLDSITFGIRQYARRASDYDAWYDQFIRDYSTHVTVLIGTKVSEPLFWQAIEARQPRSGAAQELRLRSFLVADAISPVVLKSLSDFNIVPVAAKADEFLAYVAALYGEVAEPDEMVARVNPQRAKNLALAGESQKGRDAAKIFFAAFSRVEITDTPKNYRSLYHSGATPDWVDLAAGLDATRDVTVTTQAALERALDGETSNRVFVLTGHRGAGKSTLSMRTALNLSAAGHIVFFSVGEDLPDHRDISTLIQILNRPMALFIDDADLIGTRGVEFLHALAAMPTPPVVVLALRANRLFTLDEITKEEVWIGPLTENDVEAVIDVLTAANSLGVMAGQPRDKIRDEFSIRAKKQLLVAMKEVTTGRDFDDIIRKEYNDIVDPELRLTYLIACLATGAGVSLTRGQVLACSELPPALLLSGLERELRDVLIHADEYGDRVIARHAVIALSVVEQVAPKPALSSAYKRILRVLANDMDSRAKHGEPRRSFRLYKVLINHTEIFRRFSNDIEEARSIFDALSSKLSNDPHYWLQYGSLELEYGELDFANRYINAAESLSPGSFMIRNAKGHLSLALARSAHSLTEAEALRHQGEDILTELIDERGDESDYPWHILISHSLDWVQTWVEDPVAKKKELAALRIRADEACEARLQSKELAHLRDRVQKAYLSLAT